MNAGPFSPSAPLSPSDWLGRLLLVTGTALCLAAAICFFAWNWHSLPDAVKFALPGGAFLLCAGFSLVGERKNRPLAASLALFAACMFIGMFWAVFGQIFQSGATEREFCLVWAACVTPFLLLRRTASLWNLWVALVFVSALPGLSADTFTSYFFRPLPPLLLTLALCGAALLPPRLIRRSGGLNAWLTLPLTLLTTQATTISILFIFGAELGLFAPLWTLLAGPAALAATLALALRKRHALALCELALAGLILLNALLIRGAFESYSSDFIGIIFLFTICNIAYTVFLAYALPRIIRGTDSTPATAANTAADTETDKETGGESGGATDGAMGETTGETIGGTADAPQTENSAPRIFPLILAGLGGLVSAIFLIAFTVLLFEISSDNAFLGAGVLYMAAGAGLWRIRGQSAFLLTLAPVLAVAGAGFFHFSLSDFPVSLLIGGVWAAALALYAVLNCPPLRFGAALWALLSTFFALSAELPVEYAIPAARALGVVCFAPLVPAAWGRMLAPRLRPAAFACVWTLIVLTPLFWGNLRDVYYLLGNVRLLPPMFLAPLCVANLALLAWRALPSRGDPGFPHPALLLAGFLSLGFLWYFAPAETLLALNLMLIGRFAARGKALWYSFPLFATGLFLLAASLFAFYYWLALPFSAKVLSMGIPGLCLIAGGALLERLRHPQYHGPQYHVPQENASAAEHVQTQSTPRDERPASAVFFRRAAPLALAALIMPALFFFAVSDRRAILREGKEMLLALAPRDPRAFMLGDYMELSYELDWEIFSWADGPGCLPLEIEKIDKQSVAQAALERFVPGGDCKGVPFPALELEQRTPSDVRLRLPRRYYFEEGLAPVYERARYAVLRCDEGNRCLLEGLADEEKRLIKPLPEEQMTEPE